MVAPYVSVGMIVLEPGPGMGFFTLELARRVGPQGRVIAVDVQPKMIEGLARRAASPGWPDASMPASPGRPPRVEEYAGRLISRWRSPWFTSAESEDLFADIRNALKPAASCCWLSRRPCARRGVRPEPGAGRQAGLAIVSRPALRLSQRGARASRGTGVMN